MADNKMSPMMVHYLETKQQHPDCVLFYRLGDFYEMFFEDAKIAAEELDLVMTGKDCGLEERAPMCGIPYHAAENYITRLVKKGYKVAIAEQMEDPKLAKGLVKREVIRIVTPGTVTENEALEDSRNNFLMSLCYTCGIFGVAALDVSTGDFRLTQVEDLKSLYDEINRFMPAEILVNDEFMFSGADLNMIEDRWHVKPQSAPRHYFDEEQDRKLLREHFHIDVMGLGIADYFAGVIAAGAALRYVYDTQFSSVSYITEIRSYSSTDYMVIDTATMRNLELLETLREKEKKGSLLWVLDRTQTAMGSRYMRQVISQPLLNREAILKRQNAVKAFNERFIDREEIIEYLRPVYDLERLLSRISTERANPRDLIAFRVSAEMLPHIRRVLSTFDDPLLKELREQMDDLSDLYELLDRSIDQDAPVAVKEGGIIKSGFNADVDMLRRSKTEGSRWLMQLEQEEREKTGIKTLKIKYNKVFGYCIEVTNTFRDLVPDRYIRKQTLAAAERYTTDRLEELADSILGADDKLKDLEFEIFSDIRRKVANEARRIQQTAKAIAYLDVLLSFSVVALRNNYICPKINENGVLNIKDGRHPVVERMLSEGAFVSNDTHLDRNDRIAIITGPNMAGKSTYMRQTALIVLMAQIGSFIPAQKADICIFDRIFTRVGASDDLASGQSTFMVEMSEVANILRNATADSLLILDEIGRGTSTFDGLSIAWAVVEYIADQQKLGAKALFATHYHELTELEGKIQGVQNYCIAVKENDDDLVFLRKIVPGGADKSYGIAVARLAGVPEEVTRRADQIADELTDADITKAKSVKVSAPGTQTKLKVDLSKDEFRSWQDVIGEIQKQDVSRLSPIEALLLIDSLQKKLN